MEECLSFGAMLCGLKVGLKFARAGWNGKGMSIFLVNQAGYADEQGLRQPLLPFIALSTVSGHVIPWLASQADILAEDWQVAVELTES